jgi:hypothetical protein
MVAFYIFNAPTPGMIAESPVGECKIGKYYRSEKGAFRLALNSRPNSAVFREEVNHYCLK